GGHRLTRPHGAPLESVAGQRRCCGMDATRPAARGPSHRRDRRSRDHRYGTVPQCMEKREPPALSNDACCMLALDHAVERKRVGGRSWGAKPSMRRGEEMTEQA